jgi:hypothetical protein
LKRNIIQMDNINEKLEVACQDALELEPEDAISLWPQLDILLKDLRTFSDEVNYIHEQFAAIHKQQAEAHIEN